MQYYVNTSFYSGRLITINRFDSPICKIISNSLCFIFEKSFLQCSVGAEKNNALNFKEAPFSFQ